MDGRPGAVDAAWAAFDAADRDARRAAAAAAYPVLRRRRTPGENADRERYLHRTATAACRHREISIGQLNEVLAHRGWNPRRHPVAQEAALRAAVREHRFAAYRAATEQERQAWAGGRAGRRALREPARRGRAPRGPGGRERRAPTTTVGRLGHGRAGGPCGPSRPPVQSGMRHPLRPVPGAVVRPARYRHRAGSPTGVHETAGGRSVVDSGGPPPASGCIGPRASRTPLHEIIERRLRQRGWQPVITAYTGYGAPGWARVMARVVLTRRARPAGSWRRCAAGAASPRRR